MQPASLGAPTEMWAGLLQHGVEREPEEMQGLKLARFLLPLPMLGVLLAALKRAACSPGREGRRFP